MAAFTLTDSPMARGFGNFGRSGYNGEDDASKTNKGRSGYNKDDDETTKKSPIYNLRGDEEKNDEGRSGYN